METRDFNLSPRAAGQVIGVLPLATGKLFIFNFYYGKTRLTSPGQAPEGVPCTDYSVQGLCLRSQNFPFPLDTIAITITTAAFALLCVLDPIVFLRSGDFVVLHSLHRPTVPLSLRSLNSSCWSIEISKTERNLRFVRKDESYSSHCRGPGLRI